MNHLWEREREGGEGRLTNGHGSEASESPEIYKNRTNKNRHMCRTTPTVPFDVRKKFQCNNVTSFSLMEITSAHQGKYGDSILFFMCLSVCVCVKEEK